VKDGDLQESSTDAIAVEEPLEIRVSGDTLAMTMRTPGDDDKLAVGFLFAEGIIESLEDIGRVFHCGRPGTEEYGNIIEVTSAPGRSLDIDRMNSSRRGTLTTSACGVCGRQSIQDLLDRCQTVNPGPNVSIELLLKLVNQLRNRQPTFEETGGVHAAAAYVLSGDLISCYEDVGRHNAVDKVIGSLIYDKTVAGSDSDRPAVLCVSGRASFEIVQKAAMARIPIVASVSAASSLAIDLAQKLQITLVGFVRGEGFNIYSHPERVVE
jgi:FdhD protein